MHNISVVVPTIREESLRRFFHEWEAEFAAHPELRLYIVEDNPQKSFQIAHKNATHVSWQEIDAELGPRGWLIPRRTDCVRNFGYWQAWKDGADILITLDDDCYPARKTPYLIDAFVKNLQATASAMWFNTLAGRVANHRGLYPRGFPYAKRDERVALCHGLWENVPDFDGKTQLAMPDVRVTFTDTEASPVPRGAFFPMCGMNVGVAREIIPAFYFPLMGQDVSGRAWGYNRFGDIWAGLFVKKIMDHLGLVAVSGEPLIHHDRASNAEKNVVLEASGIEANERLHMAVAGVALSGATVSDCYTELAEKLPAESDYFRTLKKAMKEWATLFS